MNLLKDLKPRHLVGVFLLDLVMSLIFCIFTNMKKYTFILALGVTLTLAACGSGSTATETKDSTSVSTDSTAKPTDSTATVVDSTKGGAKTEETVK